MGSCWMYNQEAHKHEVNLRYLNVLNLTCKLQVKRVTETERQIKMYIFLNFSFFYSPLKIRYILFLHDGERKMPFKFSHFLFINLRSFIGSEKATLPWIDHNKECIVHYILFVILSVEMSLIFYIVMYEHCYFFRWRS